MNSRAPFNGATVVDLVHACRYAGLLDASIAGFERVRRLDPGMRTSVAHTFFMAGDYERALATDNEAPPYTSINALFLMGREAEAAGDGRFAHALRVAERAHREAAAAFAEAGGPALIGMR